MSSLFSRKTVTAGDTGPNSATIKNFVARGSSWNTERDIAQRYDAIARDARYFQFANIPPRILRCLEQNAKVLQPETIQARLLAYYLFIGVVDDEIESGQIEIGPTILQRLANPLPCFDDVVWISTSQFMTEVLKRHIDPFVHQQVLDKFGELHKANLAERRARTMRAYIEQRKLVGSLTAELSYLLICDCVSSETIDCCGLMKEVGAVGCLVDSIVDARDDKRAGSISFSPTLFDFLLLVVTTLIDGARIGLRHPRMIRLFLEAIKDNFYDRRRSLNSASSPVLK